MTSNKKIHVLGLGNLGRLFAHVLANISPNPPRVTLLLHRPSLLKEWEEAGRKIEITTHGIPNSHGSFDVEDISSWDSLAGATADRVGPIENLVVTTKTMKTLDAIKSVRNRLGRRSTILFCQNGMGTVEQVTTELFPNPESRPQFLAGIVSHGVYNTGPFRSVHAGLGNITIGPASHGRAPSRGGAEKPNYLLSQFIGARVLNATEVDQQELLYLQLEKLAANAILNPFTALFRCKNGELLEPEKPQITRMTDLLLEEISQVFRALPDTARNQTRFAKEKLEERVRDVAMKNAQNTSSMLQDVVAGRETEIDFINGWIVKKGKEYGLKTENNERLMDLVRKSFVLRVENIERQFPDLAAK